MGKVAHLGNVLLMWKKSCQIIVTLHLRALPFSKEMKKSPGTDFLSPFFWAAYKIWVNFFKRALSLSSLFFKVGHTKFEYA